MCDDAIIGGDASVGISANSSSITLAKTFSLNIQINS